MRNGYSVTNSSKQKEGKNHMRSKDRSIMEQMKIFAEEYARNNDGETPSTAVFGKRFGMTRQSAFRYLKAMDAAGMIQYRDGQVTTDFIRKIRPHGLRGYVFAEGSITAGTPMEIETYAEDIFNIPPVFVDGRKGEFFVLTVKKDSMTDAGIKPGDVVLFRAQNTANKGDIVAAYIRGEGSTLKRLMYDEKGPYLWAENSSWSNERRNYGREFDVQGVAIKILKNIDYMKEEREDGGT